MKLNHHQEDYNLKHLFLILTFLKLCIFNNYKNYISINLFDKIYKIFNIIIMKNIVNYSDSESSDEKSV